MNQRTQSVISQVIAEHKMLLYVLLFSFFAHSLLALIPPLNGDEALFWEWSRRLALGYYTHPPMTGWLIALVTKIFGVSKYAIRLTSIFLHLGTALFVYLLALEIIQKKNLALLSVVLFSLLPISVILGTAMTTDCSLIFFWTAAAYFSKKAIIEDRPAFWYLTAIASGGMMLTKFMAVYFYPAIFFFLLLNKKFRSQLRSKEPYLAFIISFVLFSPFLYWNYNNKWLTFQFNFIYRNKDQGFGWIKPFEYIAGQMLSASPVLFFVLLVALVAFIMRYSSERNRKNSGDEAILLLSYIAATPLLLFLFLSFTVRVGSHWPGVVYPVASVILICWFFTNERWQVVADYPFRKKTLIVSLAFLLAVSVPIYLVVIQPKILPDKLIYIDPANPEPTVGSNYYGWEAVGKHIDQLRSKWSQRPEGFFFTTRDYAIASLLDFYTPNRAEFLVATFPEDAIHGRDFLIWEKERRKIGANTIYVTDKTNDYQERITPYFESVEELPPLVVRSDDGRILRIFYFILGRKYKGGAPKYLSLW